MKGLARGAGAALLLLLLAGCDDKDTKLAKMVASASATPAVSTPPPPPPPEKPHPRTVLAQAKKPKGIAVAAGNVFVTDVTGGDPKKEVESMDVLRIATTPNAQPVRLASKQRDASTPVVVNGDLYWTADEKLWRLPNAGSAPAGTAPVLVMKVYGGADPAIASDGAGGIVAFSPLLKPDDKGLGVVHVAAAGKPNNNVGSVADRSPKVMFLAADATNAYWVEPGKIMRAPLAGGEPKELVKVIYAWAAASDGAHLYFADSPGQNMGAIRRVPIGGGAMETLASGFTFPVSLAVDAENVYFVNFEESEGAVLRVSKKGGTVATIVEQQRHPKRVAVDDKNVYWTNAGEGAVCMAAK